MINLIDVDNIFSPERNIPLVDVRSPVEYAKGHIPESINIPLFSNSERAAIGTLYKKEGQDKAIDLGESYAIPKIEWYLDEVAKVAVENKVDVYCFRGGLRSQRFCALLEENGWNVSKLSGGYKSFRRAAKKCFSLNHPFLILGGRTGAGKTEILLELLKNGEAVIDLEGLASHRGSAFGNIGLKDQPTTEQFENNLYKNIRSFSGRNPIWLEDESAGIGRIFLPEELFRSIRNSPMIVMNIPSEIRVERLCKEYSQCGKEPLIEAVGKIAKRLGGVKASLAVEAIKSGKFEDAASIVLDYYDKCYDYGMEKDKQRIISTVKLDTGDPSKAAEVLIALKDTPEINF